MVSLSQSIFLRTKRKRFESIPAGIACLLTHIRASKIRNSKHDARKLHSLFKILAIFLRCQSSIEVYRCFARYSFVDLVSRGRRRKEEKHVPNFHGRPVVKPRSHGYISVELSTLKKRSLVMFVIFIVRYTCLFLNLVP